MFPADELSARSIRSDRTAEVFSTYMRDGQTIFVVPSNIKDFKQSLFMIAILKAASQKGYIIETSLDKEVPEKILKTDEDSFVAGYVFQACQHDLGSYVSGSSKFSKGRAAYQKSVISVRFSHARHLKKDGDKILSKRLSEMKSFTQAYWSLRTRIVGLLTSLPKHTVVTDVVSYVKSRQELEKLIHTEVIWHNRGVFRNEEIQYLDARNNNALEALEGFKNSLNHPTEQLALHFEEQYLPIKNSIRRAEDEVRTILNRRSDILFVKAAKKKRDVEYNKRKLYDKIAEFTDTGKVSAFIPSTLPGIRLRDATHNIMVASAPEALDGVWEPIGTNPHYGDVISSWNVYLGHFLHTED